MDGRAKTAILKNHSPFYFGYSAGKTHEPGFWGPHEISDDKGNNSKDSMVLLDDTLYHFVGSLKPYDYKHFLEIALEKFLKTFIKGIGKRNKEFEELVSKIGRRRYRTKSAFGKTDSVHE